ncbi:MAG: bifunctional 1-(5-phosphoribosyl)-5-((5-phosphoribosylamino)methylideneamino)imidazole-4-carboxamide isomerase/phosphoribosylanthranilate isomerase PriA [Propionibacteriaceae bacterium]|jgi:phosphoribosylanthranilate isomerase|nr:bifunctional 1-(5-phosphoribosyl)-5-((5-phosphoribosylamino)methylideneamino)imidazole-4-carboxamide isomerase/phosphoribosylanthranilate isomerase PriA [Propionibacteriaceae bacterium]
MSFTIFPAVDIQYGKAVQLYQGVSSSQKVFGEPMEMAQRWKDEGAQWLHLVDLDAAFGRGSNADHITEIVADSGLLVELTGGIRDDETLDRALSTGCERINIGTAAVENPNWCAEAIAAFPEQVAVAVDVRGDRLATRGWTATEGDLWSMVQWLNKVECRRIVVTDTESDGTLTGANVDLLSQVCTRTDAAIIASGGVASLDDIRALSQLAPQVEGVIIGTALYEGKFTFPEAVQATRTWVNGDDIVDIT